MDWGNGYISDCLTSRQMRILLCAIKRHWEIPHNDSFISFNYFLPPSLSLLWRLCVMKTIRAPVIPVAQLVALLQCQPQGHGFEIPITFEMALWESKVTNKICFSDEQFILLIIKSASRHAYIISKIHIRCEPWRPSLMYCESLTQGRCLSHAAAIWINDLFWSRLDRLSAIVFCQI